MPEKRSKSEDKSTRGKFMKCVITGMPEKKLTRFVHQLHRTVVPQEKAARGSSATGFQTAPSCILLMPGIVDVLVQQQEVELWIMKDGQFNHVPCSTSLLL